MEKLIFLFSVARICSVGVHVHCVETIVHATGTGQSLGIARLWISADGANLQKFQHIDKQLANQSNASVQQCAAKRKNATVVPVRRRSRTIRIGHGSDQSVYCAAAEIYFGSN